MAAAESWCAGDGVAFGFTDLDRPLSFEGFEFSPGKRSCRRRRFEAKTTGPGSCGQYRGGGALSDAGPITEADIAAGRYDGAGGRAVAGAMGGARENRVFSSAGRWASWSGLGGPFTAEACAGWAEAG